MLFLSRMPAEPIGKFDLFGRYSISRLWAQESFFGSAKEERVTGLKYGFMRRTNTLNAIPLLRRIRRLSLLRGLSALDFSVYL